MTGENPTTINNSPQININILSPVSIYDCFFDFDLYSVISIKNQKKVSKTMANT